MMTDLKLPDTDPRNDTKHADFSDHHYLHLLAHLRWLAIHSGRESRLEMHCDRVRGQCGFARSICLSQRLPRHCRRHRHRHRHRYHCHWHCLHHRGRRGLGFDRGCLAERMDGAFGTKWSSDSLSLLNSASDEIIVNMHRHHTCLHRSRQNCHIQEHNQNCDFWLGGGISSQKAQPSLSIMALCHNLCIEMIR